MKPMRASTEGTKGFRLVERSHGEAWLHETEPVWVVKYDGVPESNTHRYDSWQVYKAVERVPAGRDPWTVDNRRLGGESGWAIPEQAFRAARDAVADMKVAA